MFPQYIIKTQTLTGERKIYKLAYVYETIAGTMGRYVNVDDCRNYTILTLKQAEKMVFHPITPCKVSFENMSIIAERGTMRHSHLLNHLLYGKEIYNGN